MKRDIAIGITDCSKFANYEKWILQSSGTRVIRLSAEKNNFHQIEECDGVILSGGEDVHPHFYNKTEYTEFCHEIDERRDEFELKVLQLSEGRKLPLLGICRGLQVVNVYFGGTLIPDIPSFGKFNHSKFSEKDRRHTIQVDPYSDLKKIVGLDGGEVNSAHHQSAEMVGKGLVANAISPDGIIEGMEREDKESKPFLMLVQWHPERMVDQQNPFASNVRNAFLDAVRNTSLERN